VAREGLRRGRGRGCHEAAQERGGSPRHGRGGSEGAGKGPRGRMRIAIAEAGGGGGKGEATGREDGEEDKGKVEMVRWIRVT